MTEIDNNTLIAKYDRSVPRYTSFPTALQFKPGVTQDFYKQQLAALKTDEPVSLYVHIPFCHSLCHYCGCHTKIVNVYAPVEHYINTLLQEITLTGEKLTHKPTISRIHFGGGSPNYAHSQDIEKILNRFSEYFDLNTDTQIDMECDPRLLSEQKISDYARLGIRRISLGIQDFNRHVQKAINREQPFELVKTQIAHLRAAGIHQINFDLITGLPEQTLDTVQETLKQVLVLKPSRIAVFPYAHVPWMKKHQKLLEKYTMPGAQARFDMNQLVHETLCKYGYNAIGIDHYALEQDSLSQAQASGTMRRNFQGYTDDPAKVILGFGLSSISQLDEAYIQNTTDAPTYRNSIGRGEAPIQRFCPLTAEDKMRRNLIERLMCDFLIRFTDYENIKIPYDNLTDLEQDGLIKIDQKSLQVTEQGKTFVRVIAACFDPYLKKDETHHAKAV